MFSTLATEPLTAFCRADDLPDELERRIRRALSDGSTRPEWCWIATGSTGSVFASHYWWGLPGAVTPYGLDLVSTADRAVATAMVVAARDKLGVHEAHSEVVWPLGEPVGDRPVQTARDVLTGAGFSFEVDRVRIERYSAAAEKWADPLGRLKFREGRAIGQDELLDLFLRVSDGSLDHGMQKRRATLGPEREAAERMAFVLAYPADPEWFTLASTHRGEYVGYVAPGAVDETGVIAEIGVVKDQRGHRYVDELLGWGTQLLVAAGFGRIVADTDVANTPMRAAFKRGGYREFARRDDYSWTRTVSAAPDEAASSS